MKRFEAHHRAGDPFDETVVLLKGVVQIFHLSDLDPPSAAHELQDHIDRLKPGQIGAAFVDHNAFWRPVRRDCACKKPPSGCQISALGQHEFKGLAGAAHGAIEVGPISR